MYGARREIRCRLRGASDRRASSIMVCGAGCETAGRRTVVLFWKNQRGEIMRQCEDDVEVSNGQAGLPSALGQPLLHARSSGTWGSADCGMSCNEMASWPQRTHRSRWPPSAAVRQRRMASQHLSIAARQDATAAVPDETVARATDDVGHLEGGPVHRFISLPGALHLVGVGHLDGFERTCESPADGGATDAGKPSCVRSLACPRRTWMVRRSAPASNMCVAKLCRRVCGETCLLMPACSGCIFDSVPRRSSR